MHVRRSRVGLRLWVSLSLAARALAVTQLRGSAVGLPKLRDGLLDRFIVVPEHKLLFCFIEKVGSTSFQSLFRNVRARYDSSLRVGPPYFRNRPSVFNLTKADLAHMLVNRSWYKAVFYREPIERFVSAWESKCKGVDEDGREHCQQQFGKSDMNFDDSVAWIQSWEKVNASQEADDWSWDVHFRRQLDFCGGLPDTLHLYDSIVQLKRDNSREEVAKLLKRVGINVTGVDGFEALFPMRNDRSWSNQSHNTDGQEDMAKYIRTEKPWIPMTLITHYKQDYELFNMTPPDWATAIAWNEPD